MTIPDWDNYICKHCARYYGWLPASKEFTAHIRKKHVKYFTLSDIQAIDIFMFEMEGVLVRDGNKMLPEVVICEEESGKIPIILDVVRPPLREAVIYGSLQDLLTYEEADDNSLSEAWARSYEGRKRRKVKEGHDKLVSFFPFDIVNFDPNDNLLNPSLESNKLYQALERIFELQKDTDTFLLMVTTPIYDVATGTEDKFKSDFQRNTEKYSEFSSSLKSSFGVINYNGVKEHKKIAICFVKSIIYPVALKNGWSCSHKGIYVYENPKGNKYLDAVIECVKTSDEKAKNSYIADLVRVTENMPEYYPKSVSSKDKIIISHLESIKAFREASRQLDLE